MTTYKHTQIGWAILAMGASIPLVIVIATWPPELSTVVPAALLLLPLAAFGALTITITREAINVSFGIGLVKRRIRLDQIRGWRTVHSPLLHGVGMRLIQGGTLYNVRSGPAVELLLVNDRIVRIGTDEPQRVIDALASVHTPELPAYSSVALTVKPTPWRRVATLAILILPVAIVGFITWNGEKAPHVAVSRERLAISAAFYGVDLPWPDITDVSLEETLPRVQRRSNGYALGGTLRGYFDVEGLGRVRLFVERDEPPFVRITSSTEGVIYVGFGRGGGTRQLFNEISGVRQKVSGR